MKSKILMCLILTSCAVQSGVKEKYTDIVKSTDADVLALARKDDIYVCDYGYQINLYGEKSEDKKYKRYCDKDGKPLNETVQIKNRKYIFRDGLFYYVEKVNSDNVIVEQSFAKWPDTSTYMLGEYKMFNDNGKLSTYRYESDDDKFKAYKEFCEDGKISSESVSHNNDSFITIYNEVKMDGVKLNTPLIVETFKEAKLNLDSFDFNDTEKKFFIVNGERVLNATFEILKCGEVEISYTIKNGKYDGDYIVNDERMSRITKYENGEIKSTTSVYKTEHHLSAGDISVNYNKYEMIDNSGKLSYKYYLDDKLVFEIER